MQPDSPGSLIFGAGPPILFIMALFGWSARRARRMRELKASLLTQMISGYPGRLSEVSGFAWSSASIEFQGFTIQLAFFEGYSSQGGPGTPDFFSVLSTRCKQDPERFEADGKVIQSPGEAEGMTYEGAAQEIPSLGFDEIEVKAGSVEARKWNILLTDETSMKLVSAARAIIPLIVQIREKAAS